MSTITNLFPRNPREVTGENLTVWADAVHAAVAEGTPLAPLCFDSGSPESAYPDALAYPLQELTLFGDGDDQWGAVLGAFFPVAGIIDAIGYAYDSPARSMHVPGEWGYRAGAAGNTWESAHIPGDDAWERIAAVADAAINRLDAPSLFDEWMVDHDEASAAVDMADIIGRLTGCPIGTFPDSDSDVWESAVSILLAAGWCLNYAADCIRSAGDDY